MTRICQVQHSRAKFDVTITTTGSEQIASFRTETAPLFEPELHSCAGWNLIDLRILVLYLSQGATSVSGFLLQSRLRSLSKCTIKSATVKHSPVIYIRLLDQEFSSTRLNTKNTINLAK